ncbi:MAG: hypothetical protein KC432_16120 [Thermomicrobiales bacterium]|nr:hypothetical protein [Thermomicrobiales bacterium]
MDHVLFDALTRSLASRRLALGGGAALIFGLVVETPDVAAKCKRAGARCGRHRCCAGARCRRKRCRCKPGHPRWAGECCKNRFALANAIGLDPIPGTEFCCPAKDICSQDGNPAHDDCCQENETCIDGKCCCDGCRGTVICGGACCPSASCCNEQCCGGGQICAETAPGVRTCVSAARDCDNDGDCYPGETCFAGTCCTDGRMCMQPQGNDPDVPNCCPSNAYCFEANGVCCSNGNNCSTGKKVRIRV